MSTQHTPGPWFVDEATLHILSKHFESDQMGDYRGVIIADLSTALGAAEDDDLAMVRPHARPETDANARLIAAAPELLATCEALADFTRDLLKLVTPEQIKEAKLTTRMLKLSDQGFKAMAKARGEL